MQAVGLQEERECSGEMRFGDVSRWTWWLWELGQMGLQNERAGLPKGGSVCMGGPEGWGRQAPGGVALGPPGAPCFTDANQVPVIALQTPRGRRDPSGCLRKRKPRGRHREGNGLILGHTACQW